MGFVSFYMSVMHSFLKLVKKPTGPENFGDQFLKWERELAASTGPFLGGAAPRIRVLQLIGGVHAISAFLRPRLMRFAMMIARSRFERGSGACRKGLAIIRTFTLANISIVIRYARVWQSN